MGLIDVHVLLPFKQARESMGPFDESLRRYFKAPSSEPSLEEFITEFDAVGIEKLVILGWDAETATGLPSLPNDYVAGIVDKHPDRFIGFASVDPHKGKAALKELERAVEDLHLKGLKMHPTAQAFYPNSRSYYPLWEKAVELDIPVIFHTGMAAWGAGMPGGGGMKLKYSNPMFLDDVAADFPDLRILAAHPSWPWLEEGLAVALHKPNIFMDLSGWSPKYLPSLLVQYADTRLSDKCMFGSDYPYVSPRRWLDEFAGLGFKQESRRKILELNARRFLRIQ